MLLGALEGCSEELLLQVLLDQELLWRVLPGECRREAGLVSHDEAANLQRLECNSVGWRGSRRILYLADHEVSDAGGNS